MAILTGLVGVTLTRSGSIRGGLLSCKYECEAGEKKVSKEALNQLYELWPRSIGEGVKQAVLETLSPKEIKYDYVAVREVFGILGDDLPLVTVDLRPGRDAGRKKVVTDAIAMLLQKELNSDPTDLYVLFRETPAENHYTCGVPLPDWVSADP